MIDTSVGFRLSAQQERIWSQQCAEEGGATRLAHCEIFIDGPIDEVKLRDSVRDVVARYEILRTVFPRQTGIKLPFQVIHEDPRFSWYSIHFPGASISELDEATQVAQIRALAPLLPDLDAGPLLNVAFVSLGPQRSALALSLPAMCADNLSLGNLALAIVTRYATGALGDEVLQYADVAQWQEDLLTSDDTRAGREHWRDYCRDIDFAQAGSVLTAFESSSGSGFPPASVTLRVPSALAVDREVLLTCWQIFMARTLGASTLVIGCEPGSRNYDELKDAIGPLATFLPLRFEIDLESPFSALVQKTRGALAQATNWQESFAWNQLEDAAGQTPVLALAFEFAVIPVAYRSGGTAFTIAGLNSCSDQFGLKLVGRRRADALSVELHYDSSRFDAATVQDWAEQFATLLAAAIEQPGMAAWQLPLLDRKARERVLVEWNRTAAEYPREACIHELFERQAALTPERTAVACEESSLTYRELNERANRLAHSLQKAGAGPNAIVGLCLERGIGMVAGLLGILKAGAAYVPVSADHPKARVASQLDTAVALVTERKFLDQLPEFAGRTICLGDDWPEIAGEPDTNPQPSAGPNDLAYVIYTSGSTGVPKGVAVRHRNVVNYSWCITRRLELERYPDGLVFAMVSTLNADLGNTCLYPALISGGSVRVVPQDVASDSQRLRESNTRHPIDVLKIVPSHLSALLASCDAGGVLPLKLLVLGGEALTPRLLAQIEALKPGCEVFNHYGPTETTVGSLMLRVREFACGPSGSIPIGRPIANTRAYILDSHLQPVPPLVVGELYISGDGVSAGYLNRPELTAERFLADPFAGTGKMYRTGDLARWLPDGNVEFIGRADNQVKIRGFRIELGEIDATLCLHSGVSQAVTLARPDERGDARLVAYITPRSNQTAPTPESVREHLKSQLPDYMVPAAIVVLAKLPLNANGKIDRQNLPEPDMAGSAVVGFVPPRTPTEQVIAGIWAEVLRRDRVGVEDNFFEIGGHSLLGTQVMSRVRRSLEIDPPLRLLFESPTVAKLALWIDNARRKGHGLLLPPIGRVPRNGALPLSFAQQRLWVIHQLEPDNPMYNVVRALRMKGRLSQEALQRSLNEMVRRHESQRTTFSVYNGNPVQIVADPESVALPVRDLTHLKNEAELESTAREIARDEALQPFDLEKGPLVRARLIRLAREDHVFLYTAHHIVSDAWSAAVFMRELSALYEAFSQGRPSPLPEPAIQYADYAAWQRQWLEGEPLKRQLEYWRDQLKGAPSLLDLPTDRPREAARSHEGALETIRFSPELSQELKAFSRKEDVTLFMTLLGVFQLLLSRYSGQEQIVVGTDVANRTTVEAESLIGFFINLLPMRSDLSGNPTVRELLQRVRTTALGAYAHQDMPFDKLVEDLQPERRANHTPLVQVLFVMQNTPAPVRALAGLELSNFDVPVLRSKFDLAVFMVEREGGLTGYWLYRTDLFDAETVRRWAGQFETLLKNAVSQPEARLSTLELLSAEERLQRESEQKMQKQSHQKKLMATQPKTLNLREQAQSVFRNEQGEQ